MNKLFRALFGAVLAGLVLSPGAAYAASLTVTVQQVNPNSAVQTLTCAAMQKNCIVPLSINAGQPTAQSLNIQVKYIKGDLFLIFQTNNGYFYATDTGSTHGFYMTMWSKVISVPATYNVTLVQPLVSNVLMAPILSAVNEAKLGIAHPPVANLQVTVTPAP